MTIQNYPLHVYTPPSAIMLNIAARRLLSTASTSTIVSRPFTTSSVHQLKKRPTNSSQTTTPSPAPRPPHIPTTESESTTSPLEPIEPIINHPSPTTHTSEPIPTQADIPLQTPLSPPEPSPSETDYSTLPSLSLAVENQPLIAEPEAGKGGSGRTGAGRKEYVSSIEKQRRLLLRWSLAGLALGGLGLIYTMGDDAVSRPLNALSYVCVADCSE
jgi:import inner membrane translocase subunit TIM50